MVHDGGEAVSADYAARDEVPLKRRRVKQLAEIAIGVTIATSNMSNLTTAMTHVIAEVLDELEELDKRIEKLERNRHVS